MKEFLRLLLSLFVWFVFWELADRAFHLRSAFPGALGWVFQILATWVPWRILRWTSFEKNS